MIRVGSSDFSDQDRGWQSLVVAGDYDGDGKADPAVYENATGYWYIFQSIAGTTVSQQFGGSGYTPVR